MRPLDYETPKPPPPLRWSRWWSGPAAGMLGAGILCALGCVLVLGGLVVAATGTPSVTRVVVGASAVFGGVVALMVGATIALKV